MIKKLRRNFLSAIILKARLKTQTLDSKFKDQSLMMKVLKKMLLRTINNTEMNFSEFSFEKKVTLAQLLPSPIMTLAQK